MYYVSLEVITLTLAALTALIAWLAWRSNKTAEKILLTQSLEDAEMAVWYLTYLSISWAGNAASISDAHMKIFEESRLNCERAKRYFDKEIEWEFVELSDSTNFLISKARQFMSNQHLTAGAQRQFDTDASELRQEIHEKGKKLLGGLIELRRKNGARIKLPKQSS